MTAGSNNAVSLPPFAADAHVAGFQMLTPLRTQKPARARDKKIDEPVRDAAEELDQKCLTQARNDSENATNEDKSMADGTSNVSYHDQTYYRAL